MRIFTLLLLSGLSLWAADITNCTVTVQCQTSAGKTQTVSFDLSPRELKGWSWKVDTINAGQVISTNEVVTEGVTNLVVSTNWPLVTFRGYLSDALQARIRQQVDWSRDERLAAIRARAAASTNEMDLDAVEKILPK